jgi:hypothetical protein
MGLLVAGLASPALAQLDTGSLQGTVRDASGAVIHSARVPRTDLGTQRTYVVKTNGEGQYICPSLRQDSCLRLEFQHGLTRMSSQAL